MIRKRTIKRRRTELFLRVERQVGEFLLILGSLLAFRGIQPYLDKLKINDSWWIVLGFIVVGLAVNRLVSYERKLKIID